MNATSAMSGSTSPTKLQLLVSEHFWLYAVCCIPASVLYLAIYVQIKGFPRLHVALMLAALAAFGLSPWKFPVRCGVSQLSQNTANAIGIMKTLDLLARRRTPRTYTASKEPPSPWLLAFYTLIEFRYESFTPNSIRLRKSEEPFSEPVQLAIHAGAFAALHALPGKSPVVFAFRVLLGVYIYFTAWHLILRYKNSPSMFGPVYRADSLTGFWSRTWHNTFAAPCESLAYRPARDLLPRLGVPVSVARSVGIINAFGLMGIFHVFLLYPLMSSDNLFRIGMFFFLNGIATVCEAMVWGHRRHWLKTLLAWTTEICLATWTAQNVDQHKTFEMSDLCA